MKRLRTTSPGQIWRREWTVWAAYLSLAVLILLPILRPGYILTFDMAWGPIRPTGSIWSNTYPLNSLLSALSAIVPGWLVQKFIMLLIFTLAGVGAHRLALAQLAGRLSWAAYGAGLVYVLNPFVYTRFMAGQWLVLAGYALAPWIAAAGWRVWQRPGWHTAWPLAAWLSVLGLVSIHVFGMAVMVVGAVLLLAVVRRAWRQLAWLGAAFGGALLVNGWWIVGALMGNEIGERIGGFGTSQLAAFATDGSIMGSAPLSAALLQGFWADGQGRYILPSDGGWLWGTAAAVLLSVVVYGIYHIWRSRDYLGLTLSLLAIPSLIFALGAGWYITAPLAEWMTAHVPMYAGFREPQKWLVLLALAYSYGFAHGIVGLARFVPVRRQARLAVLLVAPVMFGGLLLFGARGQLQAARYPSGWAEARLVLNQRPPDSAVLVLPWNMYLPVSFAGRNVANPARHYFEGRLITGNDPELRGVPAERGDELRDQAAAFVTRRDTRAWRYLRANDVTRIVVVKEYDWQRYAWVARQPGVRQIQQNDHTIVYEVENTDGR